MSKDIIKIKGIKCRIGSSVHQNSGYIFISPGDGRVDYEGNSLGFTEDEARIINKRFGGIFRGYDSTFISHMYGYRVSIMSMYVSQDEIQQMFVKFLMKSLAD
jgi:hypothetical protein